MPTTFPGRRPRRRQRSRPTISSVGGRDYEAMYATLDPALDERYPIERFTELHAAFAEMARSRSLAATIGDAADRALPPEPRAEAFPAPTPTPTPTPDPSASARRRALAVRGTRRDPRSRRAAGRPGPGARGPGRARRGLRSVRPVSLERELTMVHGPDGWLVRWSPAVVFRSSAPTGRCASIGSSVPRPHRRHRRTVWAETREDGARVYPQEALGGQVIGYVSEVTAEDLETLADAGYRAGRRGRPQRARVRRRGAAARHAGMDDWWRSPPTGPNRCCTRPRWCPARTSRSPSGRRSRRPPRTR